MSSLPWSLACRHTVLKADDGSLSITPARIEIKGSQIVQVEICRPEEFTRKVDQWQSDSPSLQVYEDKLISPAFINPHTHLAMSFFRGISMTEASHGNMVEDLFFHLESHLTAADVRAFTRMGAYECLLNGVGLVWDHYYHGLAVAEALADTGLSGVVAPTLQDLSGPGQKDWPHQWQQTEEIAQSQRLREKGVFAAFGPHATDTVSSRLWQEIATASKKLNLPLHAHLAQSIEEYERLLKREQCSPLSYLQRLGVLAEAPHSLLVHSIFVHEAELKRLDPQKQTLGFCPFSALIFCFPANVLHWHKAGIPFVTATDCVASNDSLNVQKELRYLSGFPLQQFSYGKAMSQFLKTGTNPAAAFNQRQEAWQTYAPFRQNDWLLDKVWMRPGLMHPRFRAGTLSPGALANLIIWDQTDASLWPGNLLRTLAFGDTSSSIYQMIVAGQRIGKEGHFALSLKSSQPYQDAYQEAGERLAAVLKRSQLL